MLKKKIITCNPLTIMSNLILGKRYRGAVRMTENNDGQLRQVLTIYPEEGRKVRVFFEPRVNQSKASGKWFTSCHAWRIDAC